MQRDKFYKLLKNTGLLNNDTLPGLKRLMEKYPFFQAGWFLYLKNLKMTGDPGFETVLRKAALVIPDRKRLYEFLHSVSEPLQDNYFAQTREGGSSLDKYDDHQSVRENSLIDNFLSKDPGTIKIEKRPKDEEAPNTLVERSLAESDEMITETLAMIYFKQKNYDKALEAFKKLSLKYPEKSVYFANRIEEIEKLKRI